MVTTLWFVAGGCQILGPELAEASLECVPSDANNQCTDPESGPDGTMSARMGNTELDFRAFARPSSYVDGEVVLLGYADGLSRALQLTFGLGSTPGRVNPEMTGFWDLGLCTPHDSYILEDDSDASVTVLSYDSDSRRLQGRFSLRVAREESPHDALSFVNGAFDVRIRVERFEYCIEG